MKTTKSTRSTSLNLAVGAAFAATAALSPATFAADNPFGMQKMDGGYQLAQADAKKSDKAKDGKCGGDKAKDGKCGGDKMKDAKCGGDKAKDGKCGGEKMKDAKCGGDKSKDGKCGGSKY